MVDRVNAPTWWEKEKQRTFTKLECGLLGALFMAIAIIFVLVIRFMAG